MLLLFNLCCYVIFNSFSIDTNRTSADFGNFIIQTVQFTFVIQSQIDDGYFLQSVFLFIWCQAILGVEMSNLRARYTNFKDIMLRKIYFKANFLLLMNKFVKGKFLRKRKYLSFSQLLFYSMISS
jgi:hypothetical protein